MKPYVICHMCTSIDGKIMGNRWGKLPGIGPGNLFETTAATFGIGAWIVGTTTMKEFSGRNVKLKPVTRKIDRRDHIANPKAKKLAIGLDAKGVLRFQENQVDGDHVVLIVTQQVSDNYLAHLQDAGVSYLICGKTAVDLKMALDKLSRGFKLKKLMAEGGGKFNGSMLKAGLIDEISQVIMPVADGGMGISSFFDIPGTPPQKSAATLRMIWHKKMPGSVNWFRYRVIGRHTA